MEKIYFAHPVNMYNEPLEAAFEKLIALHLADGNVSLIENPNQPCHQVGYDKYAKRLKESGTNHKGMNYFYDEVLPNCSGCVGVPFLDGRLGLGVAGEMKWFIEHNKWVWTVVPLWPFTREDFKRFIYDPVGTCFTVRLITKQERSFLIASDPRLVVPHEETRLRTWKIYNRERRSYEEAHYVEMPIPEGFYPQG